MENQEAMKAAKNLATDIRKSQFSGKFYWDLWQQSDPKKPCDKPLNYLASHQKVILARNVASLRHHCQTEKQFASVYGCCYFLERTRFGAEIFSNLRKNSETLTQQICQEAWKEIHAKVKARLTELGLTTFQDAMRQKEEKFKQKPVLKEQKNLEKMASKLSERKTDHKKLPQSIFEKIISVFRREKPSKEPQFEQQTEEFIEIQKHQKGKKF